MIREPVFSRTLSRGVVLSWILCHNGPVVTPSAEKHESLHPPSILNTRAHSAYQLPLVHAELQAALQAPIREVEKRLNERHDTVNKLWLEGRREKVLWRGLSVLNCYSLG